MKNLFTCKRVAIQSVDFCSLGHYLKVPICDTLTVASYENVNFYLKGHIYFQDCSLLIKLIPKYIFIISVRLKVLRREGKSRT